MSSKFKYLLVPGHGGMVDGKYTTAPKKMHKFIDGLTIYEGVVNRFIVKKIIKKLASAGIRHHNVVPENSDVRLYQRVARGDAAYAQDRTCVWVEIHLNGGGGHNYEIYTSVGQTRSDGFANEMFKGFESVLGVTKRVDMSDGDKDKEAQFYTLRKTDGPAMLIEAGFMDNRKEAEWLLTDEGQEQVAEAVYQGILSIEKNINYEN